MSPKLRPVRVVPFFGVVLAAIVGGVCVAAPPPASNGQRRAARDAAPDAHSRVTFTERSPFSSPKEVFRAMEIDPKYFDAADRAPATYDLAKESFDVFAPATYKKDVPHGLLVYLSASPTEPFPNEWLDTLRRHKLVFVSPVCRGESGSTPCRAGLALDAVHNMAGRYAIDERRVYVCGYSVGGTIAAMLARARPDVFRGGLFLMGGRFHLPPGWPDGGPDHGRPGDPLPPAWNGEADVIHKETALVLVRGEGDTLSPPEDGRADAAALTREGFEHVTLLTIPRQGHRRPNAAWFEKGIAALSSGPKSGPPARSGARAGARTFVTAAGHPPGPGSSSSSPSASRALSPWNRGTRRSSKSSIR